MTGTTVAITLLFFLWLVTLVGLSLALKTQKLTKECFDLLLKKAENQSERILKLEGYLLGKVRKSHPPTE